MKRWIPILIIFCLFLTACGEKAEQQKPTPAEKVEKKVDPRVEKLANFAKELKAAAQEGVEVSLEKLEELSKLLELVLPKTTGDLAGMEWDISCSKNTDEKDMLFAVNLNRKKGEEVEQAMWFHIIYNPHLTKEERDDYGTETFEGFKASIAENAHLWVLVNNMEIRAIADAEDFKNDAKIQSVVKKFDLKEIEKF
jgi:hypothetical protein